MRIQFWNKFSSVSVYFWSSKYYHIHAVMQFITCLREAAWCSEETRAFSQPGLGSSTRSVAAVYVISTMFLHLAKSYYPNWKMTWQCWEYYHVGHWKAETLSGCYDELHHLPIPHFQEWRTYLPSCWANAEDDSQCQSSLPKFIPPLKGHPASVDWSMACLPHLNSIAAHGVSWDVSRIVTQLSFLLCSTLHLFPFLQVPLQWSTLIPLNKVLYVCWSSIQSLGLVNPIWSRSFLNIIIYNSLFPPIIGGP